MKQIIGSTLSMNTIASNIPKYLSLNNSEIMNLIATLYTIMRMRGLSAKQMNHIFDNRNIETIVKNLIQLGIIENGDR